MSKKERKSEKMSRQKKEEVREKEGGEGKEGKKVKRKEGTSFFSNGQKLEHVRQKTEYSKGQYEKVLN